MLMPNPNSPEPPPAMKKLSLTLLTSLLFAAALLYCTSPTEPVFDNPFDQESDFYIPNLPRLNTTKPFDIGYYSARTGGVIAENGGASITEAGVCYIQGTGTPGLNDMCVKATLDSDTFEVLMEDLVIRETYTVRAYVVTQYVTVWGDIYNFTTTDWPVDTETIVVAVIEPSRGRTWMDRNLGANRAATSRTDSEAYGDLYQWGRAADGHQKRNSPTTSTLNNTDQPGHGSFILAPSSPGDWRSPRNNNLWQGVNGINNPCPAGYRVPTQAEWSSFGDASAAFNSPLKLPVAGYRNFGSGLLFNVGGMGHYWSSTVSGSDARRLGFNSSVGGWRADNRATGYSVRCIED